MPTAAPKVLGELKIEGYSAYLHPLGDGLLLGVGQDVSLEGRRLGTQLSVFDVSDLRRPLRLHHHALGPSSSLAEWDHHAFLWWPREQLAVLPIVSQSAAGSVFSGASAFRVTRAGGIAAAGTVSHVRPGTPDLVPTVQRSLVVGSTLYTVSDAGILASTIRGLDELGFAAFPQTGGGASGGSGVVPAPGVSR